MFRWIDTVFPRRALFQRDRRLLHLFLGRILASGGFSIVIPFLSLYLHGTRGVPMSAVGGGVFIAALTRAVRQIVGGGPGARPRPEIPRRVPPLISAGGL